MEEAGESLELARMAVDIAGRLVEDEPCERAWLLQLRGLAGAAVAEAERRLGDREASRRAFREAKKLWDAGEEEAGDALGFAAEISSSRRGRSARRGEVRPYPSSDGEARIEAS
ncbi:MAG: hypothetical protein QOJ16_3053 [Acidobacteriota bacterium]|nr:hypothetical protein [Acidobacteriota bacterium]